jgi:uncharacterized damage-inducible protein DinB
VIVDLREFLIDQYRHMEWADASMWRAVLESERAAADEVLRERLHHIHMVQRMFFDIWRGEAANFQAGQGLQGQELVAWAREVYGPARALLSDPAEDLDFPVALPWAQQIAERLGYEPAVVTLHDTAAQVVTHTAHHRGQIATRLRELGGNPPLIDFIAWAWRGRPAADWP